MPRNTHAGLYWGCLKGLALVALGLWSTTLIAAQPTQEGIEYARFGETPLLLDLFLPAEISRPVPVIVWVHGGAWRSGSRSDVPVAGLVNNGFAIASIDYRLSPVARFPAQVHDIKAAIRYLRAHAEEFKFDPARFVIAGSSAGGHLAALVGVTNGHPVLEGTVGEHRRQSSDVQAIVSFYGASDLTTILSQSTPHGLSVRVPALQLLLGGQPDQQPDLARLASPVMHIDQRDPPLMLIHGDQDPQMPLQQSAELASAYEKAGLPVRFRVVSGGLHGGPGFFEPPLLADVATFLRQHLPGK